MSLTKNKNINFVRWGILSQREGKEISSEHFHKAPAKIGLYAFPEFMTEDFLVGWKYTERADKDVVKIINKKYNKNYKNINDFWQDEEFLNYHCDIYDELYHPIYKKHKRNDFKVIKYRGKVWHHFVEESKSPIRNTYWALDTYENYINCLYKHIHEIGKDLFKEKYGTYKFSTNNIINGNLINVVRKIYCKDEYEVYLPEKIK